MSPQAPGPPVIVSTDRRSGEAPPGGRPYKVERSYADNLTDMKPDEHMEPCSNGVSLQARSTSIVNKCRGKYRIKVKGAACHGRACCMGT